MCMQVCLCTVFCIVMSRYVVVSRYACMHACVHDSYTSINVQRQTQICTSRNHARLCIHLAHIQVPCMYCSFVNRCTRTHSDSDTEAARAASSAMRKSKRKPRPSPVLSVTSTRKLLRSSKLEHVRPARSLPAVPPREVSSPPGRPGIVGHVWEAAANSKLDMLHSPLSLRYGG